MGKQPEKAVKIYGIFCFVIGLVLVIANFLPNLVSGRDGLTSLIEVFAFWLIYFLASIAGVVACVVMLILTFVHIGKHDVKFSMYTIMALVGTVIAFIPLVYFVSQYMGIKSDPYRTTAGSYDLMRCVSARERASDSNAINTGNPTADIAEDIACAFLESFYNSGKEPQSSREIINWVRANDARNGTAVITINGEQPENVNQYNVLTRRSCEYYEGENNAYISVWYRDPEENNQMGCASVHAIGWQADIYDLESEKGWYETQFEVADEDKK